MMQEETYYAWRECQAMVGGKIIRWAGKPGLENWDRLDPGAHLLIESALPGAGQHVLDLRCGTGLAGALAAQRGALVTLCDDSIVAVEAARRTLTLHGLEDHVTHGAYTVPPAAFDAVWLNAPRGRAWARQLIRLAAHALKPDGVLYLVGPNQGGIKSYIDDVATMGGQTHLLSIKRRYRLAACTFAGQLSLETGEDIYSASCKGQVYRYASAPGVFAHGGLDRGTYALIEAMDIGPGEAVLDLGCGCGVVGLAAARLGGRVTCVDHSAVAIESTQRTMAINDIANAVILPSDCASAVRNAGMQFDVVATNPPFHQGIGVHYDVARQFIQDAARVLAPGGRLYLVANRFIRYEPVMERWFTEITTVYQDRQFHVAKAVR